MRCRRGWPSTVRRLLFDIVTLARLAVTSHVLLAAENLFLRKQLALYQERHVKPKRPDPATRVVLVALSGLLDWRALLIESSQIRCFGGIVKAGGSSGGGGRG